jgi:hypothetical protein
MLTELIDDMFPCYRSWVGKIKENKVDQQHQLIKKPD